MFNRLFIDHPASVGESYLQHLGIAARFGGAMIAAGLACFVHAIIPALFARTGSNTVKRLFAALQARQPSASARRSPWAESEWQCDYEI